MSSNGRNGKKKDRSAKKYLPEKILQNRGTLLAPLMGGGVSLEEIADLLGMREHRICGIMEDPAFLERISKEKDFFDETKISAYRLDKNKIILKFIFREIERRLASGELENLSLEELITLQTTISKELRVDTPGEATEKTSVSIVSGVKDRFQKKQQKEGKISSENKEQRRRDLRRRILRTDESASVKTKVAINEERPTEINN